MWFVPRFIAVLGACFIIALAPTLDVGLGATPAVQIAQLSQAPATSTLAPVPIRNGIVRRRGRLPALAPLRIETPTSADYLVKLVDLRSNAEEVLIYVARGSKYELKVPLGVYVIRGAFGDTWYGERQLFGPGTRYFKLVQKDGKSDQFAFQRVGNQVKGYVVQLITQVEGNLETPTISGDDF